MPSNTSARRLLAACLMAGALWLQTGCDSSPDETEPGDSNNPNARKIEIITALDREAAISANNQGLSYLEAGDIKLAETAFKQAIQSDNTFGPAYNHLGKVYYKQLKYYSAAHNFDKASQLMPNHPAPLFNVGLTLSAAGKNNEAVEYFRKALTLEPSNLTYQAELANALVSRGDQTPEVITLLRSVAEHAPRVEVRVWASNQLGRLGIEKD